MGSKHLCLNYTIRQVHIYQLWIYCCNVLSKKNHHHQICCIQLTLFCEKEISPHFWIMFSVIKSCCFIPPHFLASLSFYSNRSTALVFPLWRRNGKEDGRGLQTPRSGSSALRVHAELHASHSHPPTAQFSLGGADMQDVPSASCKLAHHPMLLSATTSHPICPEAKVTT